MFAILAMAALAAPPAGFETGNSLMRTCETESLAVACAGYASGVYDAGLIYGATSACLPAGVERGQLADVVKKYLRDHPERRQNGASLLVAAALQGAFPCTK